MKLSKNDWVTLITLFLLFMAVALLIYIALVIPGECHECMSNGVKYYMNKTNSSCFCSNMKQAFG